MQEKFVISEIVSVYHARTQTWNRPHPAKRVNNGLVLFLEGSIFYDFDGVTFTAQAGDVVLFPVNIPYCGAKRTEFNEYIVIDFETLPEDRFFQVAAPKKVTAQSFGAMEAQFRQALRLYQENTLSAGLRLRETLYRILAELLTDEVRPLGSAASMVAEAQRIIAARCADSSLNITSVARELHVSSAYLRKIFAAELRVSPVNYLIDCRLRQAETLLREGSISVTEIAGLCGFTSPEYFSRAFRARKGCPPSRYMR